MVCLLRRDRCRRRRGQLGHCLRTATQSPRCIRHARRARSAALGAATDWWRPHPPATCLCVRRGRGHYPFARRPHDCWRTYELAGPRIYTLRKPVEITLRLIGRRRLLLPVLFALAQVRRGCLLSRNCSRKLSAYRVSLNRLVRRPAGMKCCFQPLGVILRVNDCATILPSWMTNVSVPSSYTLSAVSAVHSM
jgi:hypothetical protein